MAGKHNVRIIVEIVHRMSKDIVLDDEQFEALFGDGVSPVIDELGLYEEAERLEPVIRDYSAYDLDEDKVLWEMDDYS